MASHIFNKLQTVRHGRVIVACSFLPDGTSAPTGLKSNGVASVVRAAAGVFTVTLKKAYASLESWDVTLMQAAAGSLVGELRGEAVATTATPTVTVAILDKAAGTDSDIAADADNRVSVILELQNTAVG